MKAGDGQTKTWIKISDKLVNISKAFHLRIEITRRMRNVEGWVFVVAGDYNTHIYFCRILW